MIRLLILISSLILLSCVDAQVYTLNDEQLHFRRFSSKDGLPSVYVNTILQRNNGTIWIGTKGGLTRFDGQTMSNHHYTPNNINSLTSNDVTSLFEDSSHQLWIGTSKGLNVLTDETSDFTYIPLTNQNIPPLIYHISQDENKNYWIGTSHGVYVLNKQKHVIWQGLEGHSVKFIGQSSIDKMWIGSKQGVNLIDPTNFKLIPLAEEKANQEVSFSDLSVYDGLFDKSSLWLATSKDGLVHIDTKHNKISQHYSGKKQLISDNSIWSLAKNGKDLWLGYFYDGISRFNIETNENSQSLYHPQINYTIPYDNVSKLYFDNSGLLWVGTTNGLAVTDIKNSVIKQIGEYQNITNKHVWSVAKKHHKIWFATEDGLNMIDLQTKKLTTYPSSRNHGALPNTVIWSIFPDEKKIWLGTNQGLIKFLPEENKSILIENKFFDGRGIRNKSVYTMHYNNGELLLGYYNGSIAKFNTKTELFSNTVLDVSTGYITNIIEIKKDNYLVASQHGIIHVNKGILTKIMPGSDLVNYHITAMKLIKNQLWVATLSNGLYVLTNINEQWRIIKSLTVDNGLPENSVKSLSIDLDNNIWVTGRKSVYKITPESFKVTLFTSQFHWLDIEFHDNAANNSQDDVIAMGGNEGLVYFSTNEITPQTTFPALKLSSVQIANKKYNQLNNSNNITIKPGENFYSFNVSALEFLSPESIKYEYQLLPGQDAWQRLEQSKIMLSNLPYNQYYLRLRATNSDQVFNKEELQINLNIPPPFWWATIAKIIYSLALFLLIMRFIISHKIRLKRMTFKAKHDALTGLPNRDFLINELGIKLEKAAKEGYKVVVLFFDLNGFKLINDTYGHDAGDKLLKHVANQVNHCIREKDFFARQSGDEFILVLDNIYQERDIYHALTRIQSAFNKKFTHKDKEISYGSSIGISIFDEKNNASGEDLIKQADTAMYKCKQSKQSKADYCYY